MAGLQPEHAGPPGGRSPAGAAGCRRRPRRRPRSRRRRQSSGAMSCCTQPNVTGRSISSASRRIQSSSRSGAAMSSPWMPAGASSNTPRPTPAQRARRARTARPRRRTCRAPTSPSLPRCSTVRDVVIPSAPASMPSATSAAMRAISSGVAGSLRMPRSPIANARSGPCGICAPHVDGLAACASMRVEVLGERLPVPAHARRRARRAGSPPRPPSGPTSHSRRSAAAARSRRRSCPSRRWSRRASPTATSVGSQITWPS